jgi:glycosyltransferase involved in cell wall biosynthesis
LVDGFVDDIVHKLHSSTIAVAPLLAGSGVRIKVLESMAAGLPVVSTTIGAEGIQASEADGLLRVDDPNAMAQSIVSLLNEPNRCRELGKRARKRVLEKYTWADSVSAMVQAYKKLLR